jgi:hypothetical protein
MIIIIPAITSYIMVSFWTFGYCYGRTPDPYKGSDYQVQILAAVFWPIYYVMIMLTSICKLSLVSMGEKFAVKQMNAQKVRIEKQFTKSLKKS